MLHEQYRDFELVFDEPNQPRQFGFLDGIHARGRFIQQLCFQLEPVARARTTSSRLWSP